MTQPIREPLLTKEEVRQRLNLKSIRNVDLLLKTHRIPVINLSRKTKRFHWPDIEAALAQLVIKAAQ